MLCSVSGHTHWVTSLALHPSLDYLLSSSLDGTVRWLHTRITLLFLLSFYEF